MGIERNDWSNEDQGKRLEFADWNGDKLILQVGYHNYGKDQGPSLEFSILENGENRDESIDVDIRDRESALAIAQVLAAEFGFEVSS